MSTAQKPTKEETDRLAEKYRGHKDPFGDELSDSGRRLYALRDDAGYKDWIDKDGYPVDGPPRW